MTGANERKPIKCTIFKPNSSENAYLQSIDWGIDPIPFGKSIEFIQVLPDDSANERKQLSELVRDFLLKYHDSKVRDDDDLEIAFTVGYRHGRESMIEPDSANDEDFEVDNITESRVAATKARICLKAIDKEFGE